MIVPFPIVVTKAVLKVKPGTAQLWAVNQFSLLAVLQAGSGFELAWIDKTEEMLGQLALASISSGNSAYLRISWGS